MTTEREQSFAEALHSLKAAADLPGTTRTEKRTRKLEVDLAALRAAEAALYYKSELDEANRANKAAVGERLKKAIAEARAATK